MIIFLYGKDTYRSKKHRQKMVEKFVRERDPQRLNTAIIDCEKENPNTISENMLAIPFLAEKRMVVLENFLISKHKELQQKVLDKITSNTLPKENIIIFWEQAPTYRTKVAKTLFATLKKEQYAQEFEELSGTKLTQWIASQVQAEGENITKPATDVLAQHIGSNTWQLATIIKQLCAYSHGRNITPEDVWKFIDKKEDDNIFNLVDAILAKNPKRVFAMMQEQYKQGKDAHYIYAMVLRQIKIHTQLKDSAEREPNTPSNTRAKQMGLHPFVVKKTMPQLTKYSMESLTNIYKELLHIDKQIKTGQANAKTLMEIFIGKQSIKK